MKKIIILLIIVIFASCSRGDDMGVTEQETENLRKLARVWGFAMFTHRAFLSGERCPDTELLELIPIVRAIAENEANIILYNWWTALGDDGFDDFSVLIDIETEIRDMANRNWICETYLGADLAGCYYGLPVFQILTEQMLLHISRQWGRLHLQI